jgi:hypothetical protein
MIELPPAEETRPQRVHLTSRADIVPAVVAVIGRAHRDLRCLHHDLSAFELAQPAVVEGLHAFLHASHAARARLLTDDTAWLDTHAARLKLLQRQLSHGIELRRANPDDPVGEDAALVADGSHVLVLARTAFGIGELWVNSDPRAQAVVTAFDRRWESGAHNLPVDPLGL